MIEWQPVFHQRGATGLSGGHWSADWRVSQLDLSRRPTGGLVDDVNGSHLVDGKLGSMKRLLCYVHMSLVMFFGGRPASSTAAAPAFRPPAPELLHFSLTHNRMVL
jgi:hypothetical protein